MGRKNGLLLNSLFALPPNTLQMCGSREAQTAMETCVLGGECDGVKDQLTSFRNLWPHLQWISEVIGCDPYDQEPAEMYWLGNPKIYRFKPADYGILLKYLEEQPEIPAEYIEELRTHWPKKVIPFHTYKVLQSVIHTHGINENTLLGINNCMVSWGKVTDIDSENNQAEVLLSQMYMDRGFLKMHKVSTVQSFNPLIVPNLRTIHYVACHWGSIVLKVSLIATQRLEKATQEVLRYQNWI